MRVVAVALPGALVWLALLVLGVFWCKEVIGRWREDVEELRTSEDTVRKAVIVSIWVVTFFIAIFTAGAVAFLIWQIAMGVYNFRKLMSS